MSLIQPVVLDSDLPYGPWGCRARDVWRTLQAAEKGDADALRELIARDPNLYRAEYWYTQPLPLAVRGGHLDAVRVLLEAGADPGLVGVLGDDMVTVARDRGHETVASLLEVARERRRGAAPPADQPIDVAGGTPLHRAVSAGDHDAIEALLDAGADLHALHLDGPGSDAGYAPAGFQPIDLALWDGPYWGVRGDVATARLLLSRGAAHDTVIAAALGDLDRVRRLLDEHPERIRETRPSGKRALSSAVEYGHEDVVRLLLARGADPNWAEGPTASRGAALHAAARLGNGPMVQLLLAHGADPNGAIDSSGSATYVAATHELRALLMSHGGTLDAFDLVFLGEDDELLRRVAADPAFADTGCGGALAAACKQGKRDLVEKLLDAGARVPSVLTECRSYLLTDPAMLRRLLASGMDPDLPTWQRATPLHDLCGRDGRGRARPRRVECATILLDAGASLSARDEEYLSTPLAWAARCDLPDMVELLLARGAPRSLPDDEPWARPLAWATRRGHQRIVDLLSR